MMDIVAADNLPKASGIIQNISASALKNFRQPRDPSAARGECRGRQTLLYSKSYEFDDGVYQELARHGGAVVFSFSDVLSENGFRRGIVISKMRLALASCRRAGCGFVACTLAKDAQGIRNSQEILSFCSVLGMNMHERKFAERLLERIAK